MNHLKKIFNYTLLLLITIGFLFLISRIFWRFAKDFTVFVTVYIILVSAVLLFPVIFKKLLVTYINFTVKNIVEEEEKDTQKRSLFRKKIDQIKLKLTLTLNQIKISLDTFKEFLRTEFFRSFLGTNFKTRIFFFFLIKVSNRLVEKNSAIIFLIVYLPWLLFLIAFLFETAQQNELLICLSFLSLRVFLRIFYRCVKFITNQYVLGFANIEMSIYLPKLSKIDEAHRFLLSNHLMKKMIFFVLEETKTKDLQIFLWDFFTRIHFWYRISFLWTILDYELKRHERLTRKINIIVFSSLLFLRHLPDTVWFDFLMGLTNLLGFFLIFWLTLDFFQDQNEPLKINESRMLNKKMSSWFRACKADLIKKMCFLQPSDLPYPYVHNLSAEQMARDSFEIRAINEANSFQPFIGFSEFSNFSGYRLTEKQFLALSDAEEKILNWFEDCIIGGFLDPRSSFFDLERYNKHILSLKSKT